MKKTILLLCLIFSFSGIAFCNGESNISTSGNRNIDMLIDDESSSIVFRDGVAYDFGFNWGKGNKSTRKRHLDPHWSGLGFSYINFTNQDTPGLDFQSSYSINWNIGSASVTLAHNWLMFTGVGIDWSRYHFKGDYGLKEVEGITQFVPAEDGTSYRDSKLLAYYFTIPLMLEYQHKSFFVNAGPVVYVNCYSKSQIEVLREGGKDKVKLGKGLNILPVNLRLMAHIGIGDFGLVGYYSPFALFSKDKGPDINPWGAGVKWNF
ncbi:hypothetical protein LJC52_00385 [Bacteroidales bacterium OttesenSCG-928-A17]|nr:hypothetical protein [Bacteroidales bacterium OttesenSCG-928-A17]